MSHRVFKAIAGSTEAIQWRLYRLDADGNKTYPDLTSAILTLHLAAADGTLINTAGKFTAFDAVNGKVQYTPGSTDLTEAKSPLRARAETLIGTDRRFYPNEIEPFLLEVGSVV